MSQHQYPEPIAVIGSACRFPGASSSPSKLWSLLQQPRDVLQKFDPDRLNLKRFHHTSGDTHGATDVNNKSYLLEENTRLFDASFFGISPLEAAGMDPQQRLLLETVYESFEAAGVTLDQLKGSLTSVHVGVMTNDYSFIQLRDPETLSKYNATGTANSIMSNRISYVFDLKGPSETIDTACSSSLVALHHAAQGLLSGDCETAVVAGVNLIFDPSPYITESKLHMLSPDSQSRMWDKSANGYARGEGAAALLLKPLSRALRDGDHIEGIVRSTGVNSDGQSSGITMPFAPAQAALIRQTYRRAGLDPIKDRPQYFECHGTGTPAGDPVEARAISESLLGGETSSDNPLYVGSVKTVIGHLEGCAGLAGVIRAILALKHRTIPPNLHFKELNPAIAQYYGPLQITTKALPWPDVPAGTPARASVNSFGFGGTNAHAILESYDNGSAPSSTQIQDEQPEESGEGGLGPLIFSAASGSSLLRTVQAYLKHLKDHPSVDLQDLSWLLQTRRTTHRVRTHFSGATRDAVLENMATFVTTNEKASGATIGHQPQLVNPSEAPGVLGIFTGQGAQWPAMGRELIQKSPLFRKTIEECEAVLNALPKSDVPEWSLIQELTADASSSRLSEAMISQPLCTAVQLGLVNLLSAAGISFDAVVGHSSGEIAATYASGIITIKGAMQIAYYRGFHAKLATGPDGERGGMLAAGLSFEKASQFCSRPEFQGRIQVAASNAPQSVTLSGDINAIKEAKEQLDTDNIFARQLKVDTAYHSHHMQPCAGPYLKSLLACDIELRAPKPGSCVWNSSVRGDAELLKRDLSPLKGSYWVANMVQTVLFSQAIESSIWHGGPFDLAIEVGPHPALKGPVEQTLKAAYGSVPLYTGALKRNGSDVEAFSAALGVTWAQLGPSFVDFAGFREAFYDSEPPAPKVIKDLPTYSWDHEKDYWRESRISRRYRTGKDVGHELLGRRTPDDNDHELRWRNVLKLSEMPWVRGHEVLDEVLLPGAAYVSIAVEAGKHLAVSSRKSVRLIDVENVDILRPVVVPDNQEGVETLFTAHILSSSPSDGVLRARFSYYICNDQSSGSMVHTCSGDLVVHLGADSESGDLLPPRDAVPPNLVNIDGGRVYKMFEGIDLKYSGVFRSIADSKRCLNYATATGVWPEGSLSDEYGVHPAMLDVAFQTLFIARAHPASRQITSALLPSHIDRVRVSPSVQILQPEGGGDIKAAFESWVVGQTATSLTGDLNVYDAETGKTFLQVEGLATNMVGEQDASHDQPIFSKTVWGRYDAVGLADPVRDAVKDAEATRLAEDIERVALFYIKRIVNQIGADERAGFQWYHQRMFGAFEKHLATIKNDEHPVLPSSWLADEPSVLEDISNAHPDSIDLQLLHAVGENLADVVRGDTQLLEVMQEDDMLDRFYMDNCASAPINQSIADVLQQITFKFPRCNILEIGAGTGGTTWSVLNSINNAYDSYTYTDISSGFFPNAAEKFSDFANKMAFKILDVEKDPTTQGFAAESYDVIIAANVLHATRSLETTLRNVRSLLKPGGFLVLMEVTGMQSVRVTFILGGLPGWWLGADDGRPLGPGVSVVDWDVLFDKTGFSGADTVMHDLEDETKHCNSLIVTQAVDDAFLRMREPLSFMAELPPLTEPLLVIGGKKLTTTKMMGEIQKLLPRSWKRHVQTVGSIDEIDTAKLIPRMDVICLQEADEPLFATPMTTKRIAILKSLLMSARNMLWVTGAGKSHTPRTSIFLGIARIVPSELPQLNLQMLGLEAGASHSVAARNCVEAFLRLRATEEGNSRHMLWSQEPEMEILADGQTMVPRVMPNKPLNELYNASRRAVTKTIDATGVPVQAVAGPGKMTLQAAEFQDASAQRTRLQVKYALHIPTVNGDGVYLVCGHRSESVAPVMAISESNGSIVDVDLDRLIAIDEDGCTSGVLAATAHHLLVQAIAAVASGARKVLLYQAEEFLASMVATEIASQGGEAHFASSSSDTPDSWIKIHVNSSKRALSRVVPRDVQLYVDCSGYSSAVLSATSASDTLRACVPADCEARQLGGGLLQEAFQRTDKTVQSFFKESYTKARSSVSEDQEQTLDCDLIKAADLAGADASSLTRKRYVTDWQEKESLTLTIQPLDLQGIFKPDKTYFMVGMAGGLGLSICQWMIRNGAKHLVITSRNPKVDDSLLEDARRANAKLHVMSMDVSKRDSVEKVVKLVQDTMPPIAGVCNAAMVLSDKLFIDMDVDQLNNTLAAKVYGTEHLDSVFDDMPLDFFVLLSSVATVIGNIGQANYHAANLFMTSLVAQRRARGLTGSVVHVGYISDVGYVTRQDRDRQLDQHFRNVRLMPLSETDVHHAFAEAIRGGKPGSVSGAHDIIMGLETFKEPLAPEKQPLWLANPRFAHFVPPTTLQTQQQHRGSGSADNVRKQVEEAETEDDAVAAVVKAFCGKLESILQLQEGSVNVQRAIIDLGIDSLVAVEIRTWFLKELGAEVAVVKILGGDTVIQVCTWATKKVMAVNMKKKEAAQQDEAATEKTAPVPDAAPAPAVPAKTASLTVPVESTSRTPESNSASVSDVDDSESSGAASKLGTSISGSSYAKIEFGDADTRSESNGSSAMADSDDAINGPETIREETMSQAQSRIWFLSKHLEDPAAFNMTFHYRAQGPLSMARLRHALQVTTHHHECLRMRFYPRLGDGQPMQGVMGSSLYELEHVPEAQDSDLQTELTRFKTRVWDLENGKTFGVTVLSRSAEEHDIVYGYHHLVMDVVGWHVFVHDLDKAYKMQSLDKSAGSYFDYTALQLEQEKAGVLEEDLKYWQTEFTTTPETLPLLPMAHTIVRPAEPGNESHHEYQELTPGQFTALKETCQRLRVSPFHFHLAVMQVLLARYANTEDVCIGIVDANRNDARFAQTVGCFINMLPIRSNVSSHDSFANVARAASKKALAAFAHAAVPFDMILDKVKAPRSSASTPLFQAAVNYRTGSVWELPLGDCQMKLAGAKDADNPYDISLGITDMGSGCMIEIHCQASLYTSEGCRTILDSYVRLLESFAENPHLNITECEIHDKAQVSQALELGKGPEVEFEWPSTMSQRVLDMCNLNPDKSAVKDKTVTLSYSDLAAQVHSVADAILQAGCTAGSHVATLCEPTVDATVAMLAVLHIGAVYVPLDTSLPTARHAAMVQSSKAALLLSHSATESLVRDLGNELDSPIRQVCIDSIPEEPRQEVPCAAEADAPAVLLFTSGSTGTPKGIFLSQANFVNHLALKTQVLNLGQECVLQQSSLGFDMSLIQTFCALANGGLLVVVPSEMRRDPVELTGLMSREHVSFTIATPSEYLAWLRYGEASLTENTAWRHACMGGEQVSRQLKSELRRVGLSGLRLTNCYGPTEITAAATFQAIDLEEKQGEHERAKFAVGKALPNYSVCILDASGRPQPAQHAGEICIGGAGVALGYLDLADETRRKFVTDVTTADRRMYRTGDQGRLMSDGTLLCLGRLDGDTQVKLRGLRIELQEVETALLHAADGLLSTVVVSQRGDVLVAHATLSPGQDTASEDELTQVLGRLRLPQYFIPATIIILAAMPTNSNGKLDRKAIAALSLPERGSNGTQEKMTIREGEVRLLWERVLPDTSTAGRLSPSSDFFLCGGNSLLMMKLQAAIRESIGVAISTRTLYQASTLREMARRIDEQQTIEGDDVEREIDWAAETAVPKSLLRQIRELPASPVKASKSDGVEVLMTGATSFLGGHLLQALLRSPAVRKVHCVAVLADDQHQLPRDEKIECYTGSLLSPTLGLNTDERNDLEETVDVIIHAGSSGHCLNTYDSLRTPNLLSTHFLSSLALPRSIPLLLLSSNRVVLLSGSTAPPPASVAAFPPATDGLEGYTASKWASESFLENLVAHVRDASRSPLTVAVHRPCVVVSERAPNSDALNAILRYSVSMRCVPQLDKVEGYLDFGRVEKIVDEIADSALQLAQAGSRGQEIRFRHHSGGAKVPVREFRAHMENIYGGAFDEVDVTEWMRRAADAGIDPLITAYLEGILDNGSPMVFPYLGEE
ncbi:Polyketide synthase-nonribosomal peptide synthetase [Neonectria ditissima]|uniref:Polyketide synthase-nonribosomal peptide synthetase n=1 Tax=Neonectria ditissima TaxID=78410 RepID=A0A0N8H8D2_9HYPO|nr:Polyketide synthase-nonribosomal peptide synthetase [Neonectria ditissima]